MLQHTPLAVTGTPPPSVIVPPHTAELSVTSDTAEVFSFGRPMFVVKSTSSP